MKKLVGAAVLFTHCIALAATVEARNDAYFLAIDGALQSTDPGESPYSSVKFFFAHQETPPIITRLGSETAHQRSRTNPSIDVKACNAAFLLALAALQKRAQRMGANAVVNITSFYKNNKLENASEFECHAGAAAHVMLRGEFVKIGD